MDLRKSLRRAWSGKTTVPAESATLTAQTTVPVVEKKISILNQLGSFSIELLQLRDPELIRELVIRTVNSVLGTEKVEVSYAGETSLAGIAESLECVATARGASGVLAVIRATDKSDWTPFTADDTSVLEAIAAQLGLRLENIRLEGKLLRHQESSIQALAAAIEVKDRYTSGHTKRVGVYADALAQNLPIDDAEKEKIRLAGVLHDIGKIGVPDRILLKPGSLTGEEWDEMRLHTEAGFDIVSRVLGLEEIAEILRHHHERWDGTGYPRGLKGDAIPFASRVIAVADTFDAIVTDRPYRAALSSDEARDIIVKLSGTHFDPVAVTAFEAAFHRLEACVRGES